MQLKVKKLSEVSKLPTRGSKYAAGWDLYSTQDEIIAPHDTAKIDTGVAIALPEGYFGAIYARSGLATKSGLRPANCVGVVDSDYRGPVIVALHNDSVEPREIKAGDRIAQLVVQQFVDIELEEVSDLDQFIL